MARFLKSTSGLLIVTIAVIVTVVVRQYVARHVPTAEQWAGIIPATPVVFSHDLRTPIPATSIPDSRIDAHIPKDIDPADRTVIREVMSALPPKTRPHIVWFRVPPGKPGWEALPNRGLLVLCAQYVLYYDGRPRPNSSAIYDAGLDSYLIAVPMALTVASEPWTSCLRSNTK